MNEGHVFLWPGVQTWLAGGKLINKTKTPGHFSEIIYIHATLNGFNICIYITFICSDNKNEKKKKPSMWKGVTWEWGTWERIWMDLEGGKGTGREYNFILFKILNKRKILKALIIYYVVFKFYIKAEQLKTNQLQGPCPMDRAASTGFSGSILERF